MNKIPPLTPLSSSPNLTNANDKKADQKMDNSGLCTAVGEVYNELASQLDLCNNLCAQWASMQRISSSASGTAPYLKFGFSAPASSALISRMHTTRRHPQWGERFKGRLHISLSDSVETLRAFSSTHLPALAREFDRVQAKDDVDSLFKDFELAMAVDLSRPNTALLTRYQFEMDDHALLAAHLRRLAARLDSELDRLVKVIAFENGPLSDQESKQGGGGKMMTPKKANKSGQQKIGISLEPDLMLEEKGDVEEEHMGVENKRRMVARPEWPVELALGRLRAGRLFF